MPGKRILPTLLTCSDGYRPGISTSMPTLGVTDPRQQPSRTTKMATRCQCTETTFSKTKASVLSALCKDMRGMHWPR